MSKGCSESCASNYPSHLPILQLLQRTGPDWPTLPSPSQQSWCSWATLADGRAIRAAGFQTPSLNQKQMDTLPGTNMEVDGMAFSILEDP